MQVVGWTIDVLLQHGVDALDADALMIWITEPDDTAHRTGVGLPETLDILRSVDAEIGRLLDGLAERGILESTNILVTADHGFSTRTGTQSVGALLRERGLRQTQTDVVVAGGAIHVNEGGEDRIREIVRVLQETEWVGPIFTRGADGSTTEGSVDGTLAFSTIAWDHDRSADILVTGNWTEAEDAFGFPGQVMEPGVANHGTLSPFNVRTTFITHGPDIKQGVRSTVPTGNIDLASTALALLGLPVPDGMDGRVIGEAFTNGPDIEAVEVDTREITAGTTWSGGSYIVILQKSFVAGTEYVDLARVGRR
jgi:arylsulfatase A-like enzyme